MGFEAFESVNAPYLGEVFANGIHRNESAIRPGDPSRPTRLLDRLCPDVFLLKLIPGTNPAVFSMLMDMHYRASSWRPSGAGGCTFSAGTCWTGWRAHCPRGVGGCSAASPLMSQRPVHLTR